MFDSTFTSLSNEFEGTNSPYSSSALGSVKILSLSDGSYVLSWVAVCSSSTNTGIIQRFIIFIYFLIPKYQYV